jgi:hypothetical protein
LVVKLPSGGDGICRLNFEKLAFVVIIVAEILSGKPYLERCFEPMNFTLRPSNPS